MFDSHSHKRQSVEGDIMLVQHQRIGMITLRADLSDAKVKASIKTLTGLAVPAPRKITGNIGMKLAWMSPDELLLITPPETDRAALVQAIDEGLEAHHLVTDVTCARAVFSIEGKGVREVLAKGAPIDLSRKAFVAGDFRRTRIGQVAAAFWIEGKEGETITIVCFASVADYMFDWLTNAAKAGSLPGYL